MQNKYNPYLRELFYDLYYIDDLAVILRQPETQYDRIRRPFRGKNLEGYLAALRWLSEHPEVDLTTILPGLKHRNEDIHQYTKVILKALMI